MTTQRLSWFFYVVGVIALGLSSVSGRIPIDTGVLIAIVAFVGALIAAIQSRPHDRSRAVREPSESEATRADD